MHLKSFLNTINGESGGGDIWVVVNIMVPFWVPNIIRHLLSQRVQSTSIVECRVSILGTTIMILGSIPPITVPRTLWANEDPSALRWIVKFTGLAVFHAREFRTVSFFEVRFRV